DANQLRVVVLTGQRRGLGVPPQRASDAGHLVRSDLLAVAGATDDDAQAARVADGVQRGRDTERRIVVLGVVAVRTAVDRLMPARLEVLDDLLLEFESGVVRAEVDAHGGHCVRAHQARSDVPFWTPSAKEADVSNHFTGLSLGPPLGDQRLDLCDLYAFQSPADHDRTVLILNANPKADALHPEAIYRLAVDNDGDLLNDITFSYVFSEPSDGRQTVDVFMATGEQARSAEAVGAKIFSEVEVSFGPKPTIATSGDITFFAGARSDAFFFDFDGIKNLFDTSGKRNFTEPHRGGKSPWTGVDSNAEANVFSTVLELPTERLGCNPGIRIWGRC